MTDLSTTLTPAARAIAEQALFQAFTLIFAEMPFEKRVKAEALLGRMSLAAGRAKDRQADLHNVVRLQDARRLGVDSLDANRQFILDATDAFIAAAHRSLDANQRVWA